MPYLTLGSPAPFLLHLHRTKEFGPPSPPIPSGAPLPSRHLGSSTLVRLCPVDQPLVPASATACCFAARGPTLKPIGHPLRSVDVLQFPGCNVVNENTSQIAHKKSNTREKTRSTPKTRRKMLRRAACRLLDSALSARHGSNHSYFPSSGMISRFYSSEIGKSATPDHEIDLSTEESKRRLSNRVLYRSKQRGFLELDLVLGNWVEQNIRSIDESGVRSLVNVLDETWTLNLVKWPLDRLVQHEIVLLIPSHVAAILINGKP